MPVGSLRTHAGVRDQVGTLSAISVERCPRSPWNAVRRHSGTVSGIAWNTHEHFSPEQLERLIADLEAGVYDGQLHVLPSAEPSPLPKFSDLKPFDVLAWAKRRGITVPER